MMTAARTITVEELFDLPENGGRNELVYGELRPMSPTNFRHSIVAGTISSALHGYVRRNNLGLVGPELGCILARNPDLVLAPDIAFVAAARVPEGEVPERFLEGAPDLAIKVLSPSESGQDVEEKVMEYLERGARMVWVVNPRRKTVTVHRPGAVTVYLKADQTISGDDVVPGFAVAVSEFFI